MNKHLMWLLAVPLLGACTDADGLGSCRYEEEFSDVISATDITTLRVLSDAGDVDIVGRPELNSVRVFATACSNSRNTVDDIDFDLFRNGATVELESIIPEFDNAHLNLLIEVPLDLAVIIYNDAGDIDVRDVDVVYIDDLEGHIAVRDIFFDVEILDESGNINIFNVDGSVGIDDGSGDIDVEDVGGDFIVRFDTSGSIRYRNVRGFVDIP